MKLIGTYYSPFARRVAVALISRGIAFEHDDLNGYADPLRARALNPVGKVPVLILDDGEYVIDSSAILDHLNEVAGPDHALLPAAGSQRRAVLRLAAIATTIYEQSSARHAEEQRPKAAMQPELIERYQAQTLGGLKALDDASNPHGWIRPDSLNLATISAVVAFDYAQASHPDIDVTAIAPALSAVAAALAHVPAFASTRL